MDNVDLIKLSEPGRAWLGRGLAGWGRTYLCCQSQEFWQRIWIVVAEHSRATWVRTRPVIDHALHDRRNGRPAGQNQRCADTADVVGQVQLGVSRANADGIGNGDR